MTLTSSPDYLLRPEDKALKMLFPAMGESTHNLFDEFFGIDNEFYHFSNDDNNKDDPMMDDFLAIIKAESPTPVKIVRSPRDTTPQPWRKGLWCLKSKPTSELNVGKTRKAGQVIQPFVSPDNLMNSNHCEIRSPTSPSRMQTKTMVSLPNAVSNANRNNFAQNNVLLQQTIPAAPKYFQSSLNNTMSYNDSWQQDFRNFHLQMPDNGIYLSPQHKTRQAQQETALRQANAKFVARNATISHVSRSPIKYHYPFHHVPTDNAYYSEAVAADTSRHESCSDLSADKIEHLQRATYEVADIDQYSAPVWTTGSLHSSDSSNRSQGSQYSSDSYQSNHLVRTSQNWPSSIPPAPFISPRSDFHTQIAAPKPQRPAVQILRRQQEEYHDGLGISLGNAEEIGVAVPYEGPQGYSTGYCTVTTPPPVGHMSSYPPLPPYPSYTMADASSFTAHHERTFSDSRTPSPSISPTRRSVSRGFGQRSPTRTDQPRSRRKSIHKPGPIKDTTQDESRRRTRSTSRPPRTPKTPRTPKNAMDASLGQIDFVNFTPKDSAKLMADVAPSGSSKTRQRREQEAKDKRKRLNEVALQAVRNAGGDVTVLESAIFV